MTEADCLEQRQSRWRLTFTPRTVTTCEKRPSYLHSRASLSIIVAFPAESFPISCRGPSQTHPGGCRGSMLFRLADSTCPARYTPHVTQLAVRNDRVSKICYAPSSRRICTAERGVSHARGIRQEANAHVTIQVRACHCHGRGDVSWSFNRSKHTHPCNAEALLPTRACWLPHRGLHSMNTPPGLWDTTNSLPAGQY